MIWIGGWICVQGRGQSWNRTFELPCRTCSPSLCHVGNTRGHRGLQIGSGRTEQCIIAWGAWRYPKALSAMLLKSPHRMLCSLENGCNLAITDLKKVLCFILGVYMLAITNGELLKEAERMRYLPIGSISMQWSWNAMELRTAIITPLFFLGELGKNCWGKSLCWHVRGMFCTHCVSRTHITSDFWDIASFQSLYRLTGLFSPFALIVVIVSGIVSRNWRYLLGSGKELLGHQNLNNCAD